MRPLLLAVLAQYKRWISPLLPVACRYTPTCSEYAAVAVARHGAIIGTVLALWRLMRCHPFGGRGLDPVPERMPWHRNEALQPGIAPQGSAAGGRRLVHKCEFAHPPVGERAGRGEHSSAATAAQIGILP
jgi:hypothetical protein